MNQRTINFRSVGCVYQLKLTWSRDPVYFVDEILIILNDPKSQASFIKFLEVRQRTHDFWLPLHQYMTDSVRNNTVTLYGLKRLRDPFIGRWFFGVKTFGNAEIVKASTSVKLSLDSDGSFEFPKFKEQKTFSADNVFYPPCTYHIAGLTAKEGVRKCFMIYLEECPWQKEREFSKHIFIHHYEDVFHIPFPLSPATDYKIRIKRGIPTPDGGLLINACAHASFLTYMTQTELQQLMTKACNLICQTDVRIVALTHFYRTKTLTYFEDIRKNGGVMTKYIKNFGGDQSSSLNRNIDGLFFSAHLDPVTLKLPPSSPYGDRRLHIPIPLMMRRDTNLYFADFYCHYTNHRVTLVLTHQGTRSDIFCRQRLIQLDPRWNPFLTRNLADNFACVTMGVKVEVFFTESVNIAQLLWYFPSSVFFTSVKAMGNSELKTIIGLKKKEGCTVCTLDRRRRQEANKKENTEAASVIQ